MPTWLGDCVMATPLLRALRRGLPDARITPVAGANVAPLFDAVATDKQSLAAVLRTLDADAVLLLPNAFSAAWGAWRARVPVRVGYARDGRSVLLTHRVPAPKVGLWYARRHAVVPAVRHYLGLLTPFGLPAAGRTLELSLPEGARDGGRDVLRRAGVGDTPYAVFVPGGRYGSAKLWPASHFATLADMLHADGLAVAVSGTRDERDVTHAVASGSRAVDLVPHAPTLVAVAGVVAGARLVVTNDTGLRHVAVALGVPTVTLFGPTDPRRTTLDAPHEREVFLDALPCRPCQRKTCPLPAPDTQRCLRDVSPEMAHAAARELLAAG